MSYDAKVFRVLVASPSDVADERELTVKTIQEWNDLNSPDRRIVILPLRWETHSAPEYGTRPQEIINRQVVDHCDLVIGIFWTRIGSPTGVAESGTLEEIERVANQGKPVMLYFSQVRQEPNQIDVEQLSKLRDFRKRVLSKALVESFSSQVEFRDKLAKQLEIQLRTLVANEAKSGAAGTISTLPDISIDLLTSGADSAPTRAVTVYSKYLEVEGLDAIPDYTPDSPKRRDLDAAKPLFIERENKDYYREYVEYFVKSSMFHPLGFALINNGVIGARDVYIDLTLSSDTDDAVLATSREFENKRPETNKGMLHFGREFSLNASEEFRLEKSSDGWSGYIELRALQPKRLLKLRHQLIAGSRTSGTLRVQAKIYADILPEPLTQLLSLNIVVAPIRVTAMDLLKQNNILPDSGTKRGGRSPRQAKD